MNISFTNETDLEKITARFEDGVARLFIRGVEIRRLRDDEPAIRGDHLVLFKSLWMDKIKLQEVSGYRGRTNEFISPDNFRFFFDQTKTATMYSKRARRKLRR